MPLILMWMVYNSFQKSLTPLSLSKIQNWIAQNRLDPSRPITILELLQSRCVANVKDGVKLLATSREKNTDAHGVSLPPIHIVASRASASAIAAVEAVGGSVTTRYYTPFAVRMIRMGKMDPVHSLMSRIQLGGQRGAQATSSVEGAPQGFEGEGEVGSEGMDVLGQGQKQWRYRLPDPTSRKDIEYYRDPAKRGDLSHLVPEGH